MWNQEKVVNTTWISQPGNGFEKRQCSLQVMVRGEGQQPRLAIVSRGTGKRIPEHERRACYPKVDVYFQENAWMDTKTCMEWAE